MPIVATPERVRDLPDPSAIACQRRPESRPIDGLSLSQDGSSVFVVQITRGLVADALRHAGLRTGDRIYKVDGCDVRSGRDVADQLQAVAPGFGAVIRVYRGEWLSLTFKKPEQPRVSEVGTARPRVRPSLKSTVARRPS